MREILLIMYNKEMEFYFIIVVQYIQVKPANAGIEIHREYSVERNGKWELLVSPAEVKRGELVRVDLYLSVPAARNLVVGDLS